MAIDYQKFIGMKFSRLTVVQIDVGSPTMAACLCECGESRRVRLSALKNGHTVSCGCLGAERRREAAIKALTTHGMSRTKTHNTWLSMKQRCTDKNDKSYPHYGGRGITVCRRWQDFENFLDDMGHPPTPRHSIDRIDVNGNYEPSNCRWATNKEQCNNTRRTRFITFRGERKSMTQWAESLGISAATLWARLDRYHWPLERALRSEKR